VQSVENGHVESILSLREDGSNPIATITNSQVFNLDPVSVDQMYYIRV
jgi:hypothetical protein